MGRFAGLVGIGHDPPGAGTLYRGQSFRFVDRVHIGDRLVVQVRCIEKRERPLALFETRVEKADGTLVLDGVAEVEAPKTTITLEDKQLPMLLVDEEDQFGPLVARCGSLPPMPTAVVCPDDPNSLGGALLSRKEGLIAPVFIGSRSRILKAADAIAADLSGIEIVDIAEHVDAAAHAVAMVHSKAARAVMKGNLHTDDLLGQVVKKDGGLRTTHRISHVFVLDVPTRSSLLFISDAAINITPDLRAKIDIVQNAIDLARACGLNRPKVGILAAVETVNPGMLSTLDAAALAKMADRGQIKGGIVDGPLAMDNAVDMQAARTKGISSLVAGQADVLIVPNLEAGNMLAKELTFVARGSGRARCRRKGAGDPDIARRQ